MPKPAPRAPAPAVGAAATAPKVPAIVASRTKPIERPLPAPSPASIEDLPSSDVASARSDAIDKLLENTTRGDAKAMVDAAFDFEGEATAVIAPDRAKELLEAEAAKVDAAKSAKDDAGAAAEPGSETPLSFGFEDDESTKVIAPERASELLSSPIGTEKPESLLAFPGPAGAAVPAAEGGPGKVSMARVSAHPAPPTTAPASAGADVASVVVDQPGAETRPKPPATPAAPKPAAPGAVKSPLSLPSAKPLPGMANEPTRVVRVKKKADTAFWVVLFFALAAAAAGGFVASEMMRHGPVPSWLKHR
jgi:hypothetical protein